MRSLEDASTSWQELKHYHSLHELREGTRISDNLPSPIARSGLRSAAWKAFLLFDNLDTTAWPKTLAASRSAYESLRTHFLRHLDNPDEYDGDLESDNKPSTDKDVELLAEIRQDVDRCMPENHYFRQPSAQQKLTDILFVWSKLNQDVSYRQGMHELLAPILWVVDGDAIDLGQSSKAHGEDANVSIIFDAESVEHDAFALFSRVMQSAKSFYEGTTHQASENPIVQRSQKIFEGFLPLIDPELSSHLHRIDISPQIFLIRWIRLLFGREFPFEDVLTLWDALFANDATLELVDYIVLSMLLRLRWELLASDYNSALTLLLRYPIESTKNHAPQTLVYDALYLRTHPNPEGTGYLVLKYTGRPLQPLHRPVTPPALQRNITAFSGLPGSSLSVSPTRNRTSKLRPSSASVKPQSGLEVMLSSTARNIYARGGKVVKSAVDEVHKRAQEIREVQTPSLPPRVTSASTPAQLVKRVRDLELRNKQLGKLLEGAVGELWEVQRVMAEVRGGGGMNDDEAKLKAGPGKVEAELESLSVAIAKVQFVQVYLDDTSLPLPAEDEDVEIPLSSRSPLPNAAPPDTSAVNDDNIGLDINTALTRQESVSTTTEQLADPDYFDEMESGQATPVRLDHEDENGETVPAITVDASVSNETPLTGQHDRPALAEGKYSFMLGAEDENKDFHERKPDHLLGSSKDQDIDTGSGTPTTHATAVSLALRKSPASAPGFLFGEAEDKAGTPHSRASQDELGGEPSPTLVVPRSRRVAGKGRKVLSSKEVLGEGDDVFASSRSKDSVTR
ncbi:hypothetical protein LTR62_005387 [Meristemomyces frigidus]|uniref:Rab-GAP TBC domain-containing protein n=1 Tax=Meristemomyces frigidus TaxID=1508187 RepID=A0AAN7YJC6_9PEZI|nr:hypothetical protein LTR62_005387 [Meristemomyces frigidus]